MSETISIVPDTVFEGMDTNDSAPPQISPESDTRIMTLDELPIKSSITGIMVEGTFCQVFTNRDGSQKFVHPVTDEITTL